MNQHTADAGCPQGIVRFAGRDAVLNCVNLQQSDMPWHVLFDFPPIYMKAVRNAQWQLRIAVPRWFRGNRVGLCLLFLLSLYKSIEEGAVSLERLAEVFRRGINAVLPLPLQRAVLIGELLGDFLD